MYPHCPMFQSTRPRGTRPTGRRCRSARTVSIHASARDATHSKDSIYAVYRVSIHASARDATSRPDTGAAVLFVFQSTRPRGTRLSVPKVLISPSSFNPRVREGRDGPLQLKEHHEMSFNPRVREGRDLGGRGRCPATCRFNPRVREGRDLFRVEVLDSV